jgi:hypothetical protein
MCIETLHLPRWPYLRFQGVYVKRQGRPQLSFCVLGNAALRVGSGKHVGACTVAKHARLYPRHTIFTPTVLYQGLLPLASSIGCDRNFATSFQANALEKRLLAFGALLAAAEDCSTANQVYAASQVMKLVIILGPWLA